MRIIGVTGGVGAGKSTVLELLKEEYGAELLMADAIGRKLQEPGGACYEAMRGLFGEGCLLEDGTFDRKQIAAQIFSDEVMKEMPLSIRPCGPRSSGGWELLPGRDSPLR